jgi:hypothetical protein
VTDDPDVGRCAFAATITRWRAAATPGLDGRISGGDSPGAILTGGWHKGPAPLGWPPVFTRSDLNADRESVPAEDFMRPAG